MELFSLRILARAAAIVLITCLFPAKLHAGDLQALLLDASYANAVRWNAGASLLFSHDDVKKGGGSSGIIVGGSVGRGGMQAWGGKGGLIDLDLGDNPKRGFQPVIAMDVRAVVARTSDNPLGASPNSTYVGGEVGLGLLLRFSVGYARRISGASTGDGHIVTGGVGVEIGWLR